MKTFILILIAIFAMTAISTAAQTTDTVTVNAGQQKSAKRSKLKIKFVSVVEDSRCPVGVNCIWEGNAKIKVMVTSARGTETFEMNTGLGPKGNQYDGWAINLDSLTPLPKANVTTNPKSYQAKFTVTRLKR